MNVHALQQNRVAALAHLMALFPPGDVTPFVDAQIEIAHGAPDGGPNRAQLFSVFKLDEAVDYAIKQNQRGDNVYVGAAMRKGDTAPFGRANGKDFLAATCAWAECDDAGGLERIRAVSREHGLLPAIIVKTGTTPHVRPHVYFRFDVPVMDGDRVKEANTGLKDAFGGDAVQDPARVMRLAGMVNYPSAAKKVERGYAAELVTIQVEPNPQGYAPARLSGLAKTGGSEKDGARRKSGLGFDMPRDDDEVLALLEASRTTGKWHASMRDAIATMIGRGWTDLAIRLACAPYCDKGANDSDLDPLIDGARTKWDKPDPDPGAEQATGFEGGKVSRPFRASERFVGEPPARAWIVEGWIAEGVVNSLYGPGGAGKTLLGQQLAYCVSIGAKFMGLPTKKDTALCFLCEDDEEELHRRHNSIKSWLGRGDDAFSDVVIWPRVGTNNLLVTWQNGKHVIMPAFQELLDVTLEFRPGLMILDTLADLYGGNEIDRAQSNHFVKTVLGNLILQAKEAGFTLTILFLAHPSQSGVASGTGTSGSTAWENAVRSRSYLRRPAEGHPDERELVRAKANYASAGEETVIRMLWKAGVLTQTGDEAEDSSALNSAKTQIKHRVDSAWRAKRPYVEKKGHKRNLHVRLESDLGMIRQEVLLQAIRELLDDDEIVKSANTGRRGYRLPKANGDNDD